MSCRIDFGYSVGDLVKDTTTDHIGMVVELSCDAAGPFYRVRFTSDDPTSTADRTCFELYMEPA